MSERSFEALGPEDEDDGVEGGGGGTSFAGEFNERTKGDDAFAGEFGEREETGRDNESRESLPDDVPVD